MPYLRRNLILLFSTILFVFIAKNSLAQYPGMRAVYHNIAMQNLNRQMQFMMMNMNNNAQIANKKYSFMVTLKDSSKKTVKSKIYFDTSSHKSYLLLVDKKFPKSDPANREQKIYADQTLSLSRSDSIYMERSDETKNWIEIKGVANDSCWMFKAKVGPISIYSFLSEVEMYFDPATICGVQLNDGPVVKYNSENLKTMIGQDKEAMKYLDKKNYYEAIDKFNRDIVKAAKK
jgi:hypothetical protein